MKKYKHIASTLFGVIIVLYSIYPAILKDLNFVEGPGSPFRFRGPGIIIFAIGFALIGYGVFSKKFEESSESSKTNLEERNDT